MTMRFNLLLPLLLAVSGPPSSLAWLSPQPPRAATTSLRQSTSSSTDIRPTVGQVVSVDCRLQPVGSFVPEPLIDGVVLHENDPAQTLTFVLGRGNYLPGLHDAIQDMRVGEQVNDLVMDAGWGDVNPNLIATVSFQDSGIGREKIKVGSQLQLANGMSCVVTAINDDDFVIDANPPLAGASFKASIQLLSVDDGPDISEYSADTKLTGRYQVFTCALGCFWGGELYFMRQLGVVGTSVGYTQGSVDNPSYKQVCSGTTGHTEAIMVTFDPEIVSYDKLVHLAMDRLGENKYLLNQVGNDRGTQYRHGIYYHTPEQKAIAEAIVASFGEDCKTECLPAKKYYFAEDYHQQYLLKGGQSARKKDPSVIRCYG